MNGQLSATYLVIAILFFHPQALLARGGQQPGSNSVQQPGSMDGQVTNSVTGEPVGNAFVRLMALRYRSGIRNQPQTSSQADGTFHFDSIPPGNYVITAERDGFVSNQLNSASKIVSIAPGQALNGVAVSLTPQGSIAGRVEQEDGTPVPFARVEALAAVTTRGLMSFKLYSTAAADKTGKFALAKLPPNDYYVVAEPAQSKKPADDKTADDKLAKEGDLVRTVYPRSLDIEGGSSIPVGAGQSVPDITVRMRRAFTFHVRGRVADTSTDSGLSNLKIAVSPRTAVDSVILTRKVGVNANGTFDVGALIPGAYTLRLTGNAGLRGRNNALLARQEIEIGSADLDGLVLSVMSALTVTGQVRVAASGNSPVPRVSIVAKPLEDMSHATQGLANIAADGSFTFTNLDPGLYVFHVFSATPGMYAKSITLNQQDVLDKEVDLSGLTSARLEVLMSPGAGEVDGTVQGTGDTPVSTIVLVPEVVGPDGSGVLFSYSRSDGSFAVKNVRPGKYFGYAVQRGDPNLWQNPDFLRVMQSQGASLEIDENSRQQIQLPLLASEQVEQAAGRLGLQVH